MRWYYNLKISSKLVIGFVLVAIIAGIVGTIGVSNIKSIDKADTLLYEQNTKPLGYLGRIGMHYRGMGINVRNIIIDRANNKEYLGKIDTGKADIASDLKEYGKNISSDVERKEYEKLTALLERVYPLYDRVISLAVAGQAEEAQKVLAADGKQLAEDIEDSINTLFDENVSQAQKTSEQNSAQANAATFTMIAVIIAAVVISIGLGTFISRIISNPLKEMVKAADKLALGDVNVHIDAKTRDEIGSLMQSFEKMIVNIREQAIAVEKVAGGDLNVEVRVKSPEDLLGKNLKEMIEKNNEVLTNINSASEQVASGAKQVSDASMSLSQGATEQASSVEQLTASIEEISAQTKSNADNANQANNLAENARAHAELGNNQMKEMLGAMKGINVSSSNIYKIIKVIDEIAFQTNILALNAAVEAARAGQHGKGFAVVAEEVRNLAARSADAAKETTEMIEGAIKNVDEGTKIANETADALNMIVDDVAKVAGLVNDIAIASSEQATGIEQVNQGIMQVSQVIQINSATSEESAAASEELSSQAALLKEQVGLFRLKRNSSSAFRGLEELSPDVLRMLESMSEKKKKGMNQSGESFDEAASTSSRKIVLSDSEFGKY